MNPRDTPNAPPPGFRGRQVIWILFLLLAVFTYYALNGPAPPAPTPTVPAASAPSVTGPPPATDDARIAELARQHRSGVIVTVAGTVMKILPDDTVGDRHQRFLLRLSDDSTVLVAHNIDLGRRVPVRRGDRVTLHGEYEWNDRGGVVHWTHHDPRNHHENGWIELDGQRYD